MPLLWDDPFVERDTLNAKGRLDAKFKSYRDFFKTPIGQQKGFNIIEASTAFPALGKSTVTSVGMTVDNPSKSKAVQDLNEEYSLSSVAEEAALWQELSEKHNAWGDEWEMNMAIAPIEFFTLGLAHPGPDGVYKSNRGRQGLKNAKFGDIQYGVWAAQAWDGLMQNIGLQGKWSGFGLGNPLPTGRSTAYLRDLMLYDFKRITGKTAKAAQSELSVDVRYSKVSELGKFTSIGNQIGKYVDMFKEAHEVGGQTIVNAMWKEMHAGRPINFDRDKWMQFITLKPEDDPRYQDLITEYNYSPEKAKEVFYRYVGRPLKAEDKDGETHYTSLDNPASVYFFAGRRSSWGLGSPRSKFAATFGQARNYEEGKEPLLLYSPGRYQASFIAPVGTKAFRNISGTLDFTYALGSEIIGAKGTKGVGNLFKNLRRINPLLDAADKSIDLAKGRKLIPNSPKGQADEVLDTVGDTLDGGGIDNLPDDYQGYIDSQTGLFSGLRTRYRDYRIKTHDKRQYTFLGKVPVIFRETKDELISSPFQMKLYQSIIDTVKDYGEDAATYYLKTNPAYKSLSDPIHAAIIKAAKDKNINRLMKIHGDLIDTGITVGKNKEYFPDKMLPRGAAFFRNKVSREMFKKGKELADMPNPNSRQRIMGQALQAIGTEDAAYKSLGSYLGSGSRYLGMKGAGLAKTLSRAPGATVRAAGLGWNFARKNQEVRKSLNKKGFRLFVPDSDEMTFIDNADELVNKKINIDDFVKQMKKLGKNIVQAEQKIPFEEYLGFSSNLYSNTNPYFRSTMTLVPDYGIKGLNKSVAIEQLVSHMTVAGYTPAEIGLRVAQFRKLDYRKKHQTSRFMIEQAGMDIDLVRRKKGLAVAEKVEAEVLEKFGINKEITDLTGYFIGKYGDESVTYGHPGNNYGGVETHSIKDWRGEDFIVDSGTGHLLSEFAENVQGFVDYRIIRRALGPLYTSSYEAKGNVLKTLKGIRKYSTDWTKYHWNWWDEYSQITPEMTGIIHTKKFASDWMTTMADHYTRKVFKPVVLLRAAFLTRVFLEEQARFAAGNLQGFFNHPMHYIMWVKSGVKQRKMAIEAGKLSKAELDAVKLMQSYEHFEAIQKSFTLKGLLGRNGMANKQMNFTRVSKDAGLDKYAEALSFELMQLRNDPIAKRLARDGYGSAEFEEWIMGPQGQKVRDDIADWGGSKWDGIRGDKNFINQYVQSIEARIRLKTGGNLAEGEYIKDAAGYRYNIQSNRASAGSDQDLLDFISTGELRDVDGGKSIMFIPDDPTKGEINQTNLWRNQGNEGKLRNMLRRYVDPEEAFDTTGAFRGKNLDMGDLKYAKEVTDQGKLVDKYDKWVNTMFTYLMTKPIGYLNRSVAFKQYRYQYLLANWENIQAPARRRFIEEAIELNVPKPVLQEMYLLSDTKPVLQGAMDFDLANNSSRAFGLTGTKNLLYDASKKHLISDITRNIFPFPEIWFEVASTWSKLLADKPYMLRQAHVGIRTGENFMTESSSQRGEGFIAPNPQNKSEKMFVWPFSGFLSSLIYGENIDAPEGAAVGQEGWTETQVASKAYLSGINLLGQGFVPGPNPMVAFALDKVKPTETWNAQLKDTLFGGFLPPTKVVGGVIPAPPWFKKLAASVVNIDTDEDVNWEFEQMRAASTIQVYRYGMITGQNIKLFEQGKLDKYLDEIDDNWSEKDVDFKQKRDEAFLLYSKHKSGVLFRYQALAQFMLPTGFQPTYYVKDETGVTWHASVLADEYRKLLLENDNDDTAAAEDFINTYGLEHGWLTAPSKVTKGGRASYSYRVAKFREKYKDELRGLKLTAWLVLPENPAEKRASSDLIPEKTQLTPDEFRRNVNDTIGYFRYQHFQNLIKDSNLSSNQEVIVKRWFRNELILQLPGFQEGDWGLPETISSKDMFLEMKLKWLDNDLVMSMDSGKGFALMMEDWVEFEKYSAQLSPTKNPDWWLQSTDERAVYMRMLMNQQAQSIIEEYPEFFHVWTSVMLKLFRDDKELLMEMPK
tara:strand:+ start:730 stop:6744 length:6015 start_codon:yes stop_codon:yes gene_type:complete